MEFLHSLFMHASLFLLGSIALGFFFLTLSVVLIFSRYVRLVVTRRPVIGVPRIENIFALVGFCFLLVAAFWPLSVIAFACFLYWYKVSAQDLEFCIYGIYVADFKTAFAHVLNKKKRSGEEVQIHGLEPKDFNSPEPVLDELSYSLLPNEPLEIQAYLPESKIHLQAKVMRGGTVNVSTENKECKLWFKELSSGIETYLKTINAKVNYQDIIVEIRYLFFDRLSNVTSWRR